MKTIGMRLVVAGMALAAFGVAGCQMEDKEASAPETVEQTMDKAAAEHPAEKEAATASAKTAAEKAAQAKPKDHPAH
jgi:outer membrane murein-binding lipoprotein Lpp